MKEQYLLSTVMSSREAHEKLLPYIDPLNFSDLTQTFLDICKEYYEKDKKATKVDKELALAKAIQLLPKRELLLKEYIERLPEPSSLPNLLALYDAVKKERLGLDIIQAITSGREDKAKELMTKYSEDSSIEEEEIFYNATPIDQLEIHFTGKNLLPLRPTAINEAIGGGIPRQSQICVFARPDVGKSTVAINIACGVAEEGFKVLYIGNEDPAPKMMYRILSRFARTPEKEIRNNTQVYYEKALEAGYSNLYFIPMHPGTIGEVRKWVEKIHPDLLVIDQIRNMHIKTESMTVNLEQGVIATRNLAKEFNMAVLVITQAGASANGKIYLDMDDVEWSNTGVAGQMDLMIGVGQSREMKENRRVMLSFPKNKLSAPITPFSCEIDYETQRLFS
jgi:KaiC/GvpD/RAD55 family RecA-like ATPase